MSGKVFGILLHRLTCVLAQTAGGLVILAGLTSCARPNYQDLTHGNTPTTLANQNPEKPIACLNYLKPSNFCLELTWPEPPGTHSYDVFHFLVFHPEKKHIPMIKKVKVSLWMPTMGHGSAIVYVKALEEFKFEASHVSFFMPGAWQIRFFVEWEGGGIDETSVDLELP